VPHDTLLRVRLETGRTHQIRAHLLAIGHPVAGDPDYGTAGRYGLERQFLHAARLAFSHPVTNAAIEVISPVPADLATALARAWG
jgi:23S rRNA pseudouridine1911/1915/1917 synthase